MVTVKIVSPASWLVICENAVELTLCKVESDPPPVLPPPDTGGASSCTLNAMGNGPYALPSTVTVKLIEPGPPAVAVILPLSEWPSVSLTVAVTPEVVIA